MFLCNQVLFWDYGNEFRKKKSLIECRIHPKFGQIFQCRKYSGANSLRTSHYYECSLINWFTAHAVLQEIYVLNAWNNQIINFQATMASNFICTLYSWWMFSSTPVSLNNQKISVMVCHLFVFYYHVSSGGTRTWSRSSYGFRRLLLCRKWRTVPVLVCEF
jgi:hypothetical protein